MTDEEQAYELMIPEDGDTAYGEAAALLLDADRAKLAAVISARTGATPEGAQILADAFIWYARDRREILDMLEDERNARLGQ